MEAVSFHAIEASVRLARERGSYASFEGSLWSQGVLPIDSLKRLRDERWGEYLDADFGTTLEWDKLRDRVRMHGMRNSNVMAIAPTATIANITGVSQSIEPTYQNLFVKSNLSGEFTVVNPYLVHDLKGRGLWDNVMVNDLKYYDGSVARIDRVPEDLKQLYATAFEVEPRWLVDAREPAPEVDRPGPVPEPLHRGRVRQEARRHLPDGVDARPENDLLPAFARGHGRREIDSRDGCAERGGGRGRPPPGGCPDGERAAGLRHRRSRLRSLSVTNTRS